MAAYDKHKPANPGSRGFDRRCCRGWNGPDGDIPQAMPLLETLAYQHLLRAMVESASKDSVYDYPIAPAAAEKLLRARPPGWFADYDEALLKALADAVEEGQRMQGPHPEKWIYGKNTELTIANPIIHAVPLVGKYFDIGPEPMSGSPTTVKQLTRRLGPSMRMAADLSDWEKSRLNVVIGQSGQILSRHYRDQWETYYVGSSFPMPYRSAEAKAVLRLIPAKQ